MSVEIRPFRLGDEMGIYNAHKRSITEICNADYSAEQIAAWTTNMHPQRYLESREKNGERYWVIDDGGTIGGFAGWYGERICGFYMHPDYVGRGLGRKLFTAAEDEFWGVSGREVCLIESTVTAKPFYERMGYQVIRSDAHECRNGVILPVWHLRKDKP